MARYVKQTRADAAFNGLIAALTRTGLSFAGSRVLAVRGRATGEWRTTPVNPLRVAGERYLVAPRGHTHWVRNLRVAGRVSCARADASRASVPKRFRMPTSRRSCASTSASGPGRSAGSSRASTRHRRTSGSQSSRPISRCSASRLRPPRDGGGRRRCAAAGALPRAREPARSRPGRRLHDLGAAPRRRHGGGGRDADRSSRSTPATPVAHDEDRAEWKRRGLLDDPTLLRNLFDDARIDPSWLREAALPDRFPRPNGRTARSRMPPARPCSSSR